jgi:hypothetical protein
VCDQVCNKILNAEFKGNKYVVDEVETQLREKRLRGSQTQDIHYSENKASNKAVTLTYPNAAIVPLHSNTYLYVNAFQPGLLPKEVFNRILTQEPF